MLELSVIIVSFNTKDVLNDCISSIYTIINDEHEVIVVDNNSQDGSCEMVKSNFGKIVLIENVKNLGFGTANNVGMNAAQGDYCLLLNSDTLASVESIADSCGYMEAHPDIGVLGCRLEDSSGRLQLSSGSQFNLLSEIVGGVELNGILRRTGFPRIRLLEHFLAPQDHARVQEVDWVSGAFMLLRKQVFLDTQGFDEKIFMYGDEQEWCCRIKKSGWKVVYYPKAHITHIGKGSSSEVQMSKINNLILDGTLYFFKKHRGLLVAVLFKNLIFIFSFIKLVVWVFVYFLTGCKSYFKSKVNYQRSIIEWYFKNLGGASR